MGVKEVSRRSEARMNADKLNLVAENRLRELLTMEQELKAAREVVIAAADLAAAEHDRCVENDLPTYSVLAYLEKSLRTYYEARWG